MPLSRSHAGNVSAQVRGLLLALTCALSLTGCLAKDGAFIDVSGRYLDARVLRALLDEHASPTKLVATIGEPQQKETIGSGGERWIYTFVRRRTSREELLWIRFWESSQTVATTYTLTIEGGVLSAFDDRSDATESMDDRVRLVLTN